MNTWTFFPNFCHHEIKSSPHVDVHTFKEVLNPLKVMADKRKFFLWLKSLSPAIEFDRLSLQFTAEKFVLFDT